VVENIKDATNSSLKYVFDTIGNESSSVTASQAISEQGGGLCTVRPGKAFTENVTKQTKVTDVLVWTAFLGEHKYREFYWPVRHVRVGHLESFANRIYSRTRKITSFRPSSSKSCPTCFHLEP
jgi:Zn-dependent alcohol dehydrogenase